MTGSRIVDKVLDYSASTAVGQYLLKRVDSVLRTIERPVKYSVYGENKDNQKQSWLIFWLLLINIQINRVLVSTILVSFKKNPITSMDILKEIQKWRRSLRCTRFKGTRLIQERKRVNGANGTTGSDAKDRKRTVNDALIHDLFEELLNRTFSESTDVNDSTFVPNRSEMTTSSSSTDSDRDSQNSVRAAKSEEREPTNKSNEAAADSECALNGEDSATSHTEESQLTSASNSELSGPDDKSLKSGKPKNKESLNKFTDPTDILIAQLTKIHEQKSSGNKTRRKTKGRQFSLNGNEKFSDRPKPLKAAKSEEAVNRL